MHPSAPPPHPLLTLSLPSSPPICSGSLFVKTTYMYLIERLEPHGYTLLYRQPANSWMHVAYMVASIVALDAYFDSYFYFGHRMQHVNKWLYKNVHAVHHWDVCPRAISGYSFHIIEALVDFLGEFFMPFLFPINYRMYRGYLLASNIIHVGGHAGYEFAPLIPFTSGLIAMLFSPFKALPQINTVLHHDMHHRFPNANFALYFTHWDRLLKTEHPSYRHQAATSEVRD